MQRWSERPHLPRESDETEDAGHAASDVDAVAAPEATPEERATAKRARAEQQERDRAKVWSEIADRSRRADENTARLKELRLARDRLSAAVPDVEVDAKPRARARSRVRAASAPR